MLFSYEECKRKYNSDYQIKKAVKEKRLFKLRPGIYSDRLNESDTAIISKKYPNAVFTLNSAFYYQGLTDTIPEYYYLATDKDASKIADKYIKQVFDNNNSLNMGIEEKNYCGDVIKVFSKERLLVELIRNKNRFSFDYYKEILNNYRRIIYELDFKLVEDYANSLPKTRLVMEAIQMEVF